jgi:Animal haem peroxidase
LEALGRAMRDDQREEGHTVLAGYTYLGQFIDHDLTFDVTPLELAHADAETIRNFRTPFLDLDHVYAGGPTVSPFLYDHTKGPGEERFLIGKTREPNIEPDPENDLPRTSQGIALTGDPRQDENLIIAQLHVAFLKFHNRVMDELCTDKDKSAGPAEATCFEQARRLVTWNYQYIVFNDYLETLISPDVFTDLKRRYESGSQPKPDHFRIPIEFSAAAFRFGHSMVRDRYHYNAKDIELRGNGQSPDLLTLTGIGGRAVPALPGEWVIKWEFFFQTHPWHVAGRLQRARDIDTKIAIGLHNLKLETVRVFSVTTAQALKSRTDEPAAEYVLPVMTLRRGARMGLPSGQDIARELGLKDHEILNEEQIASGPHAQLLRDYGFDADTPLWYYILKEAELLGWGTKRQRLGPLGSRIVGEVVARAITADPNSYLSVNPKWKPPFKAPVEEDTHQATETMAGLLYYVFKTRPT